MKSKNILCRLQKDAPKCAACKRPMLVRHIELDFMPAENIFWCYNCHLSLRTLPEPTFTGEVVHVAVYRSKLSEILEDSEK